MPSDRERDRLRVAENTGAREILTIRVMGGWRRRYAGVEDIIVAMVEQANPNGTVKKAMSSGRRRAHEEGIGREDGTYTAFDEKRP